MLADRARLKTPIPAYRSYTLVADVYSGKVGNVYGYDGGMGALTPTDFRGYSIIGIIWDGSYFTIKILGPPPNDIFSKVEIYYAGSLIATYLRSATYSIVDNVTYKEWYWGGVSNPFSAGYTYEVRIYP